MGQDKALCLGRAEGRHSVGLQQANVSMVQGHDWVCDMLHRFFRTF